MKDGTTITTSLGDFPKLTVNGAGKYAKFWSDKDFTLTADKSIMVAQCTVSQEMNALCPRFPAGTPNGTTYNALRCPVQDGVHTIHSTKPVGIMVYGYYNVGRRGHQADQHRLTLTARAG